MIMVSSAFVHAILLKLKECYHLTGSPRVFKRGILSIYFELHISFIDWQWLQIDYVWVRKQHFKLSRNDQVTHSLTAQTLDLGLYNICSGMYNA